MPWTGHLTLSTEGRSLRRDREMERRVSQQEMVESNLSGQRNSDGSLTQSLKRSKTPLKDKTQTTIISFFSSRSVISQFILKCLSFRFFNKKENYSALIWFCFFSLRFTRRHMEVWVQNYSPLRLRSSNQLLWFSSWLNQSHFHLLNVKSIEGALLTKNQT